MIVFVHEPAGGSFGGRLFVRTGHSIFEVAGFMINA
jgi:hypothetical protein